MMLTEHDRRDHRRGPTSSVAIDGSNDARHRRVPDASCCRTSIDVVPSRPGAPATRLPPPPDRIRRPIDCGEGRRRGATASHAAGRRGRDAHPSPATTRCTASMLVRRRVQADGSPVCVGRPARAFDPVEADHSAMTLRGSDTMMAATSAADVEAAEATGSGQGAVDELSVATDPRPRSGVVACDPPLDQASSAPDSKRWMIVGLVGSDLPRARSRPTSPARCDIGGKRRKAAAMPPHAAPNDGGGFEQGVSKRHPPAGVLPRGGRFQNFMSA